MPRNLAVFCAVASSLWCNVTSGDEAARVAEAVRAEVTRENNDPAGRPLPVACHWNSGRHPRSAEWGPKHQMELIAEGHYLLPWFSHPAIDKHYSDEDMAYYEGPIRRACELGLPIGLTASQWESGLSREPYLELPPDENPNVVDKEGKVRPEVSPFGPVEPWEQIGRQWTSSPAMQKLQAWYPDPPRVIFLSNNEHRKLTWRRVEESSRWAKEYGEGKSDEFKRNAVAEGWIARYRALQNGMRQGLESDAWRQAARFVGYNAFGPEFIGRWGGWPAYSLHRAGQIDPNPLMWDGGSPSYYTHDWNPSTDHTTWSPQIEFMNLVFMQAEAYRLNPDFWLEMSVWDGYDGPNRERQYPSMRSLYRKEGQTYDPARYGGFVQFGMWLLRPRAVREYRGWTFDPEEGMSYFMAIVEAVDRVHDNPILREFWRKGRLAPNRAHQHPYQAGVPAEYRDCDRWFLLDADVNPQEHPWKLSTDIPVFALALVHGESPNRRWLVYAHSPVMARKGVVLTVPDYQDITVDVTPAGSFWLVDQQAGTVEPVAAD